MCAIWEGAARTLSKPATVSRPAIISKPVAVSRPATISRPATVSRPPCVCILVLSPSHLILGRKFHVRLYKYLLGYTMPHLTAFFFSLWITFNWTETAIGPFEVLLTSVKKRKLRWCGDRQAWPWAVPRECLHEDRQGWREIVKTSGEQVQCFS